MDELRTGDIVTINMDKVFMFMGFKRLVSRYGNVFLLNEEGILNISVDEKHSSFLTMGAAME